MCLPVFRRLIELPPQAGCSRTKRVVVVVVPIVFVPSSAASSSFFVDSTELFDSCAVSFKRLYYNSFAHNKLKNPRFLFGCFERSRFRV